MRSHALNSKPDTSARANGMEAVGKVIFFLVKALVGIFLAGTLTAFFSVSDLVGVEISRHMQWVGLSGICICAVFLIDWILPGRKKSNGNPV